VVSTKVHYKESNLIIYFPSTGNEGRDYQKYGVAFRDRETGVSQPCVKINLEDVLKIEKIQKISSYSWCLFRIET